MSKFEYYEFAATTNRFLMKARGTPGVFQPCRSVSCPLEEHLYIRRFSGERSNVLAATLAPEEYACAKSMLSDHCSYGLDNTLALAEVNGA